MLDILSLDASTLAKKIRHREISSQGATNIYIQRIQQVNSKINAVVEDRFDEARKEAKACDQAIADGTAQGKLFGVPISMKECFSVTGMRTTGGLPFRKNEIDGEDAEMVKKLRQEGAIILAKTNTPSLCLCQETDNALYGRTNNPWNLTRTVGGSTGGEAALIAVGGAAVGIGADIGGSIRFPAHFNGVVGFKSGQNQVNPLGHYPLFEETTQSSMIGLGALAKSVKDTELIHSIIADHPITQMELDKFEYIAPQLSTTFPMSQTTISLIDELRAHLKLHNTVHLEPVLHLGKAALWWQKIMSYDGGKTVVELIANGKWLTIYKQYASSVFGVETPLHPYLTWALMGMQLFKPNPAEWNQLKKDLQKARQEVHQFLQKKILVLPVYHSAAPNHGEVYREIFSIRKTFLQYMPYVAYANTFALPSLVIPVGEDQDGMPISIQFITANGQESALFQAGYEIEQSFRGYKRCEL
ncbi:Asp-tRNA(Asn)/Glu-tRNA(Gln) amidotransferase A subunit family amidase [Croceifilum oryzae]|uniref:Asp-tRNA(Asn)/Glu-tRNA(Gln) amidotransferase A subunit family amidase n=1 Tax=Croceifilum oryzae TaxID=1553429 RepID=A0AAJ1TM12_9BACL|nr:amidase [Croceifilum oryzae]MDQ0417150.1 Asp-tRNA(Asn)/Glu-tRNA(Gln) amidotransferase A subunit family amidase [Croceifilum oryzae]